jgi:hypothetical protein
MCCQVKVPGGECALHAAHGSVESVDSLNWPSRPRASQHSRGGNKLKPDDHSEVVPLLPIPNRTVKRLCADDSADSRVKVGHRQATNTRVKRPVFAGRFCL